MQITIPETAEFIKNSDNIYILSHQSPDGDTLGSAFALWNVLKSMGKKANIYCSDGFPKRYDFLYEGYYEQDFEPQTIISVDVADEKLLGSALEQYKGRINLCIDHHVSNTDFAERTLLNSSASAACEVLFALFKFMNITLDKTTAECLYVGMATDTGCFKYENTTIDTHIAAAVLMKYGIDYAGINRKMFDVKSKARIKVEQYLYSNIEYALDDKCAFVVITQDIVDKSGIEASEFEGLASMTLQAEGVEVGMTIKEKDENTYKVSMRSANDIDVSALCQQFGGGGHIKAAGCSLNGTLDEVREKLINAIKIAIEEKK